MEMAKKIQQLVEKRREGASCEVHGAQQLRHIK
jgi:hypothetical protein